MGKLGLFRHLFLALFWCSAMAGKKVYVVQMKAPVKPTPFNSNRDWFAASLHSVDSNLRQSNFLYTYNKAMQGYAVSLDPKEADALSKQPSVLGVYESKKYKLLTTHTPEFLNVVDGLGPGGVQGTVGQGSNDVIIGLLDSGIWPESKSFNDAGFSDVPQRWLGSCQKTPDFDPSLCNNKLIGAQFFGEAYKASLGPGAIEEILSPRDRDGHGTHTSSTAAGSPVSNASYLGLASGTAQGMAPHARVAMYKVCWGAGGCFSPDILAGFDRAITDGVDILSVSLGGEDDDASYDDMISVGAFSAMENGITVSASAGNNGPADSTLCNGSPWVITVGASTVDRDFPAFIELGNNKRLTGSTLYVGPGINEPTGLVYNNETSTGGIFCLPKSLDSDAIKGKVVICAVGGIPSIAKEKAIRAAGGVGIIIAQLGTEGTGASISDPHVIPAVEVESEAIDKIMEYVTSDRNPTVRLKFGMDRMNVKPAPVVASFSSRGPYRLSPQIMKPDVIAPGVNILAAWPSDKSATNTPDDKRMIEFNIESGTSMSAPHVSGVVALLKVAHPDWSPSIIKSALMTTAYTLDNTGKPILDSSTNAPATPLVMGAGHINPRAALNPGLVYNITRDQYIAFLCSLNYDTIMIQRVTRHPVENCLAKLADPAQLNYPSFSVIFSDDKKLLKYSREVTNVGEPDSVYDVVVNVPALVSVEVVPNKLVFKGVGEKQTYTVTFTARGSKDKVDRSYGSIVWKNGKHIVQSPVGFSWL